MLMGTRGSVSDSLVFLYLWTIVPDKNETGNPFAYAHDSVYHGGFFSG